MEMLPDTVATAVGRKATVIVVCSPAPTFKGSENPLTLKKAEPVAVI
jgi:alpha/beta superfamily hydrolase